MALTSDIVVHLGAGPLGLGLTLPILARPGRRIRVFNRQRDDGPRDAHRVLANYLQPHYFALLGNEAQRSNRTDNAVKVDLDSFTFLPYVTGRYADNGNHFLQSLADPECHLLTTAVGAGRLADYAPLIASAIVRRAQSVGCQESHLYVIACENRVANSHFLRDEVLRHLVSDDQAIAYTVSHVHFLNCSVDRICDEVEIRTILDTDGDAQLVPVVLAERYGEIVIDAADVPTDREQELRDLFPADLREVYIAKSHDAFQFLYRRKSYIVNGSLLALAIYAAEYKLETLLEISGQPEILSRLRLLHGVMGWDLHVYGRVTLGLTIPETDLEGDKGIFAYTDEFLHRIADNPTNAVMVNNLKDMIQLRAGDERLRNLIDTVRQRRDPRSGSVNMDDFRETLRSLIEGFGVHEFLRKAYDRLYAPILEALVRQTLPVREMPEECAELIWLMSTLFKRLQASSEAAASVMSRTLRQY